MTLKQFGRHEFTAALEAYANALKTGQGIVAASLRIHRAKAGVPKRWWPSIGRVFRENGGAR